MNRLNGESQNILNNVISLIYFMRGSVSYTEAWAMSYLERDNINNFIKQRIETEAKSMHPVY